MSWTLNYLKQVSVIFILHLSTFILNLALLPPTFYPFPSLSPPIGDLPSYCTEEMETTGLVIAYLFLIRPIIPTTSATFPLLLE